MGGEKATRLLSRFFTKFYIRYFNIYRIHFLFHVFHFFNFFTNVE
ncbi:hypothetical protein HNQ34_000390 [Anoxybacillus tepidamans]|uniref:Uncharacterized protein n=1 Tax=Anoxybacteroides tepidamans TaxID=265948 RepID=A0A7W8IMN5_9BACL|nr:hypothetical protein [Anoxybacillus tepidamans]